MNLVRSLSWCVVALWATWSFALDGLLRTWFDGFAVLPTFGWVLLATLASSLDTRDLPALALVFALGRCATSIEGPAETLAACLAVVGALRVLRLAIDMARPAPLAVFVLIASFATESWFALVHQSRVQDGLMRAALEVPASVSWLTSAFSDWPSFVANAIAALCLAPLLRRLPGLPARSRSSTWPAVASFR